ncbi:MAG: SRPBCC family protein [Actinophytocola sp.]|uniref:SRPBCC family protein n=1 Tax=Actinophytocola sp. TaxID=1872138 RepID=UPI003D6A679F
MTTRSDIAMDAAATAHELELTRVFDAPRELVFACWTDPAHLAQWWGPAGYTPTGVEADAVEGGAWRFGMRDPEEGGEHWASGVYLEVVPPERLVFSFRWDPRENQPDEDTLVTITFADRDGKTEMTFHQSGFATVESRDGHTDGWRSAFDDLAAHVHKS